MAHLDSGLGSDPYKWPEPVPYVVLVVMSSVVLSAMVGNNIQTTFGV